MLSKMILKILFLNNHEKDELSFLSKNLVANLSWQICADKTINELIKVIK
jgi:hypothetical protein